MVAVFLPSWLAVTSHLGDAVRRTCKGDMSCVRAEPESGTQVFPALLWVQCKRSLTEGPQDPRRPTVSTPAGDRPVLTAGVRTRPECVRMSDDVSLF